ncbi:MAG: MMPL family transporter [Myxococcales bacterium]|nr:MMPL family transporter [Myxococcales bacterium]
MSEPGEARDGALTHLVRMVVAHRIIALSALLSGTLLFGYLAAVKLENRGMGDSVLTEEDKRRVDELHATFGEESHLLVIAEGDVFSMPYLEKLRELHEELAAIDFELKFSEETSGKGGDPGLGSEDEWLVGDDGWGDESGGSIVDRVVSLINARDVLSQDDGIHIGGLLDAWPQAEDLAPLRERVLENRVFADRLVDASGRYSMVALRVRQLEGEDRTQFYREVSEVARAHQTEGFRLHLAGDTVVGEYAKELTDRDTQVLRWTSRSIIAVILFFLFRHVIAIVGPLIVVILAGTWTFGLMALFGGSLTVMTNILPAFLACVAIGDSVHILSNFRVLRQEGLAPADATVQAVKRSEHALLLTSTTTAGGLASLMVANFQPVRELGLFGAVGVMVALLLSVVVLPLMISITGATRLGGREGQRKDVIGRFVDLCDSLSRGKRGRRVSRVRSVPVLVVATLVLGGAVFGASQLEVSHFPLRWLPAGAAPVEAAAIVDEQLGGTSNLYLMVEVNEGSSLRDRALLLKLERLEEHIVSYGQSAPEGSPVRAVVGILDAVRQTWQAFQQGGSESFAIPGTERGVSDVFTMLETGDRETTQEILSLDGVRALMTVRIRSMDANSYVPLVEHVRSGIQTIVGDAAQVEITGSAYNEASMVDALVGDLLRSLGLAFIVITVFIAVSLRDHRLGLVGMVPNLLPVVIIFGIMGLSGIPLDVTNILLGSIVIGVAVDDTVHVLHGFHQQKRAGRSTDEALSGVMGFAGRALTSSSVILAATFGTFAASSLLSVQRFGMLIGLTVLIALLVDLIVTPALLRMVHARVPVHSVRASPVVGSAVDSGE